MNSTTAAVFLRQQLFVQASIEDVSLSELEMQMVCAPESGARSPKLMAEFESRHNLVVFEAKISTLLHHAHERCRKEKPKKVDLWEQARRALANEDHYLFQVWNVLADPATRSEIQLTMRIGVRLLVALGLTVCIFVCWIALTRSH